jgi:hypothetical protein
VKATRASGSRENNSVLNEQEHVTDETELSNVSRAKIEESCSARCHCKLVSVSASESYANYSTHGTR